MINTTVGIRIKEKKDNTNSRRSHTNSPKNPPYRSPKQHDSLACRNDDNICVFPSWLENCCLPSNGIETTHMRQVIYLSLWYVANRIIFVTFSCLVLGYGKGGFIWHVIYLNLGNISEAVRVSNPPFIR